MSRKIPIFYSALLLTGVNLLLRFIGTSFQVFLSGRIGAEGIGLLQLVLSVGSMTLVAGMAGIRTATMYLTAEEIGKRKPQNVTWVLSACILYSILFSSAIAAALYIFAPFLAETWIGNPNVVSCVRLFAVFLPINCLTGVMVGYFTGAKRIGTLAAVEVAEQLLSMICTVSFLSGWAGHDPVRACQSVVIGSCVGTCLTLFSLVLLRLMEKPVTGPRIPTANRLLHTALPLALADDLRTGISTLENLMVPKRLALFPGTSSPLAAFGTVCGMVFPVLMFPTSILYGLTELLVPELAQTRASGHDKRIEHLVTKSLRVALMYGAICGGILFLCAEELSLSLYKSYDAGRYLRWFAPLAVMLYCDIVTDAMIKGMGQQKRSVLYNIITNTMDVTFLYFFLPKYGIAGYFFSFLITHAINFWLSIRCLLKTACCSYPVRVPMTTLFSAAAAVWICSFVAPPLLRAIAYVLILISLLVLTGIVKREDLRWLKGLVAKRTG